MSLTVSNLELSNGVSPLPKPNKVLHCHRQIMACRAYLEYNVILQIVWANCHTKFQETFETVWKCWNVLHTEPISQCEDFSGRQNLWVSFLDIQPKFRHYWKNFSNPKRLHMEVFMRGELSPKIYHSQLVDSIADPITSEHFNSSWKFITNYR